MGAALSFLLTIAALACLALAMDKHHRQAFGRLPTVRARRLWQVLGALVIVVSPAPWIAQEGPTMALVTWVFCGTPLAGLVVVSVFSILARRTAR